MSINKWVEEEWTEEIDSTTKAVSVTSKQREEYLVDTTSDLEELPATDEILVGSIAFCLADGKLYVLNSSDEWVVPGEGE